MNKNLTTTGNSAYNETPVALPVTAEVSTAKETIAAEYTETETTINTAKADAKATVLLRKIEVPESSSTNTTPSGKSYPPGLFSIEGQMYARGAFWLVDPEGEIEICHSWLLNYLVSEGFYNLNHAGSLSLVWEKTPNVIYPTNITVIKNHVLSFIKSLPEDVGNGASKDHLEQKFVRGIMNYICGPKLEALTIKEVSFLKDTADTSYVFFRNGVVKVTSDTIELVPYDSISAKVWSGKIKPFDYDPDPQYSNGSVIEKFMRKICNEEESWYISLFTHLGYLLHRYIPGHLSVMVAFLDRYIPNYWEAHGGTGKSMLMRCVKLLRDVERFSGKQDLTYTFAFDTVTPWTDIIYIEDLRMEVSIEQFFVGITEATSIKRKYKQQLVMSEGDRQKYAVTSNYLLRMPEGSSSERRIREIEIGDHYNDKYTPYHEFGHEFFSEWNVEEYQRFYHFMLGCLQLYLKKSILPAPNINKELRRIRSYTSDDFIQFMDDILCEKSGTVKLRKDEMRELFRKINPNQKYQHTSQNKFTSMMKKYFDFKKIPYTETPLRSKKYFEIQLPPLQPPPGAINVPASDSNDVLTSEQAEKMFENLTDGKQEYNTVEL